MSKVARWESKGGAHWAELHENKSEHGTSYHYTSPSAGGTLGAKSLVDAVNEMQPKMQPGYFHPDDAKHPMGLVHEATSNRVHALFNDRRVNTTTPAKSFSMADVVPNKWPGE